MSPNTLFDQRFDNLASSHLARVTDKTPRRLVRFGLIARLSCFALAALIALCCAKAALVREPTWLELPSPARMERLLSALDTSLRTVRIDESVLRFVDIDHAPTEVTADAGLVTADAGLVTADAGSDSPPRAPDAPTPWLFIHGLNGTLGDFGELLIEATKTRRVMALNLPGHGGSASLDGDYSIDAHVRAVRGFIRKARVDKVDLVCHSLGGHVCIAIGLTDFAPIRSITLIDSAGIVDHDQFIRGLGKHHARINLGRLVTETDRSLPYATRGDKEAFRRFLSDDPRLLSALESFVTGYREKVGQLAKPTLIVWGGSDDVFGLENAFLLHESVRGSRLQIMDGAGHCPQLNDAKKVLRWIELFQEDLPR